MMKYLCPSLGTALIAAGFAQAETRELAAHQHGHGTLNIAFEGASVVMELEAPGADIVGFEHPAESVADRALVDAAIADLAKPLDLFVLPAGAGCTVTSAAASLIGEDDHDEHGDHDDDHKDEHADHAEKHDDDHKDDHADHAEKHDDDHEDDHADHAEKHDDDHADHDGEESTEGHTEFHAEYALTCADPSAIDVITFAYFKRFPNAAELDIQLISAKGAKGFEVESDDPQLDLSGAI